MGSRVVVTTSDHNMPSIVATLATHTQTKTPTKKMVDFVAR